MWFLVLAFAAASGDLQVKTTGGVLQGFRSQGVNQFLGIPFALPPVGPLRWSAPRPASWSGVKNATAFGPSCLQASIPAARAARESFSEDCLSLNVFAPPGVTSASVLFWVYGGGLSAGASSFPWYEGAYLAAKGVVVVTVNYRLGQLGFIALPGLDSFATGAFGLLDQQLAMKWTSANAAAFGGDASKITIFGQSAGGSSVVYHLIARSSWPYYSQAIVQSGAAIGESRPLAESVDAGVAFAAGVGCSNSSELLECMRALPAEALVTPFSTAIFVSVNPEGFLPITPVHALAFEALNPVALLAGDVANEGTEFVFSAFRSAMSPQLFAAYVSSSLPPSVPPALVAEMLQLYPCNATDCRGAASQFLGDSLFTCSNVALLLSHSGPSFSYAFNHVPSYSDPILNPTHADWGAYHGSELPFVFDTLAHVMQNYTAAEAVLATDMSAAWVAFATTADPSISEQPRFVPFKSAPGLQRTAIETGTWAVEKVTLDRCSFWFDVYLQYF
jgi:para-nitrobenzyl esterase